MRPWNLVLPFLLLPFVAFAGTPATLGVEGLWLTDKQTGRVEIADCGDGTPCGNLVWADPETAIVESDVLNKDSSLRDRPLIGVPIVWGYRRDGESWSGGSIYNPEDGKTFSSKLRRLDETTLEVKGCLGPICRTMVWTRVED